LYHLTGKKANEKRPALPENESAKNSKPIGELSKNRAFNL